MANFIKEKIPYGEHHLMGYSAGEGGEALLLIHGGPGAGAATLMGPHERYAEKGFRVITWDQLGCGESDTPDNDALWTIARFTDEVKLVVDHYGLKKIHVLGRSWGGVLAIEFALKHPEHMKSLTLGNTLADGEALQRGLERFKMDLGITTYEMMSRREALGTTQHPEYQAAITLLARRHMCRVDQWPESLENAMVKLGDGKLRSMELIFGKNLFHCNGEVRQYNRLRDLHNIVAPTLVITSEHDYVPIDCALSIHAALPNSELALMKGCSHVAHFEDPEQYHAAVGRFLEGHVVGKTVSPG